MLPWKELFKKRLESWLFPNLNKQNYQALWCQFQAQDFSVLAAIFCWVVSAFDDMYHVMTKSKWVSKLIETRGGGGGGGDHLHKVTRNAVNISFMILLIRSLNSGESGYGKENPCVQFLSLILMRLVCVWMSVFVHIVLLLGISPGWCLSDFFIISIYSWLSFHTQTCVSFKDVPLSLSSGDLMKLIIHSCVHNMQLVSVSWHCCAVKRCVFILFHHLTLASSLTASAQDLCDVWNTHSCGGDVSFSFSHSSKWCHKNWKIPQCPPCSLSDITQWLSVWQGTEGFRVQSMKTYKRIVVKWTNISNHLCFDSKTDADGNTFLADSYFHEQFSGICFNLTLPNMSVFLFFFSFFFFFVCMFKTVVFFSPALSNMPFGGIQRPHSTWRWSYETEGSNSPEFVLILLCQTCLFFFSFLFFFFFFFVCVFKTVVFFSPALSNMPFGGIQRPHSTWRWSYETEGSNSPEFVLILLCQTCLFFFSFLFFFFFFFVCVFKTVVFFSPALSNMPFGGIQRPHSTWRWSNETEGQQIAFSWGLLLMVSLKRQRSGEGGGGGGDPVTAYAPQQEVQVLGGKRQTKYVAVAMCM